MKTLVFFLIESEFMKNISFNEIVESFDSSKSMKKNFL